MSEDFRIKYRPKALYEFLGNDHIKMIWENCLRKGYIPRSIILSSNFGMGKTTLARIMANDIISHEQTTTKHNYAMEEYDSSLCDFLQIRRRISEMSNYLINPVRVVFFDEAHRMPDKAQDSYLKAIEEIDSITFIFATTDMNKIDMGLRQRSDKYRLEPPEKEILMKELLRISVLENIRIGQDVLDYLIDFSGYSPRECLGNLQTLSHYNGTIDIRFAKAILIK